MADRAARSAQPAFQQENQPDKGLAVQLHDRRGVSWPIDPETGIGFGVKWRSPIGLVRLYLGYPVTADDDRKVRFHLRLGADL